jgi:hypothetical protein
MSTNSNYNVVIAGETVATKSKKAQAIADAEARFTADPTLTIEVQTGAGTVVETFEPKVGGSKPWTRTEDHEMELEVPDGYTVAYKRTRVGALVARADDKSDWIVITEQGVEHVKNTVDARMLTNALAAAHKEAQVAVREAAAQAKAEAKVKRDAEKAEKAAAKEAEKAEKAAAKQAEKDAKEAAAAAAAAAEVTEAA